MGILQAIAGTLGLVNLVYYIQTGIELALVLGAACLVLSLLAGRHDV